MTTAAPIADAGLAQRRAANPLTSAWVSANAGSGKTRVLIDRAARLLLAGVRPERILCLTYTTAAAAEMKRRLAERLGRWALLDDAPLAADLAALDDMAPGAGMADLDAARRLFAAALETPGGLKVQTIHAFCDAALRRFPLEAGVSPAFALADDAARDRLAEQARDRLAEAAERGDDDAFDRLAALSVEETMAALHKAVLARRALFRPPADAARVLAACEIDAAALGEAPFAGFWDGVDSAALAEVARVLCASGANDGRVGLPLAAALAEPDPDLALAHLTKALRTGGAPRKWGGVPVKAVDAAQPFVRPRLIALSDRYEAFARRAEAADAARRALTLWGYGHAFLRAYEAAKAEAGLLDYDDLIERARALLEGDGAAAWAQFKLDGGVEHVLVDEAQDTAPAQWAVALGLAQSLLAGDPGEGPLPRTLFVVGDEKQSIYSFQGAEPALFGRTSDAVGGRLRAAGLPFVATPLIHSFRSGSAILQTVDATFAQDFAGLGGAAPMHRAARRIPARVDLWPLLEKDPAPPEPPWDAPLDAPTPANPRLRLARMLAAEIARWLREETLPGTDRRVTAGDILVLVRKRDVLAGELVRELKRLRVDVAGSDRVKVGEHLAVRDLAALARVALTPEDDLSLAALLRSPLFGLSLEALEAVAAQREGSLWGALRAAPEHSGTVARLEAATAAADFLRPYEFFERALTDGGGRKALLARLGPEAEDAVDELLAAALGYEAAETPTLEGFLAWLDRSDLQIKRELDGGAGALRVMTVHGAKGLEAPVVVLPDCGAFQSRGEGALLAGSDAQGAFPLWRTSARQPAALVDAKEAAKTAAREEGRRLLYVAMTRAERWLVVCGAGKPAQEDAEPVTWHALVRRGLEGLPVATAVAPEGLEGAALRFETGGDAPVQGPTSALAAAPALPDWLHAAPSPPAPAPVRRAAGALAEHAPLAAPGGADPERARARGTAVHALLERLPDAPVAARPALAARLLDRLAPWADAAGRAALLLEAEAAMAAPGVAAAFGADALAEAAVSLTLGPLRVSGRIDRLHVGPDTVLAVDFKTDAAPPPGPDAAPEPYLRQLAAYREALRRLHPGRAVTVALLWTALPRLDRPSDAALDAALARAVAEASAGVRLDRVGAQP